MIDCFGWRSFDCRCRCCDETWTASERRNEEMTSWNNAREGMSETRSACEGTQDVGTLNDEAVCATANVATWIRDEVRMHKAAVNAMGI